MRPRFRWYFEAHDREPERLAREARARKHEREQQRVDELAYAQAERLGLFRRSGKFGPRLPLLVKADEVAQFSGKTVRQVYHDIEKGALVAIGRPSPEIRVYWRDLIRYLHHEITLQKAASVVFCRVLYAHPLLIPGALIQTGPVTTRQGHNMPHLANDRGIDPHAHVLHTRSHTHTLECSRSHLYREIEDGRLHAARLNGRGDYRITGEWLLCYLETLRKETASELAELRRNSRSAGVLP